MSLRGIAQVLRRLRCGGIDESELERHLAERGLMSRLLSTLTRAVRKPWQMYPIGLHFGLGFDTATEISHLVLASGGAAFNLPGWEAPKSTWTTWMSTMPGNFGVAKPFGSQLRPSR